MFTGTGTVVGSHLVAPVLRVRRPDIVLVRHGPPAAGPPRVGRHGPVRRRAGGLSRFDGSFCPERICRAREVQCKFTS